jgi:DNA-binding transcriptional LysR family regulator
VNVEYLRYALAVERTGAFSAAARECRVSQPSLSKGIAQLEGALGGKLFDRSTRGVSPTPFGDQILPLITAAVNSVDALTAAARELTTESRRIIRLGVSPLIDAGLVARAFDVSRELMPERSLMLHEANMQALREGLLADELDIVLMPAIESIPGCEQRTVYREPLAVLRPPAHDAERVDTGRVTLDSLADDQIVLVPDQCGLTSFTTRLFADSGNTLLRYPGEAAGYGVLEEWSRLGLGTALLPVSKLTDSTRLAPELQHQDHPVLISYEAAWRTGSRAHAELARLVDALAGADE